MYHLQAPQGGLAGAIENIYIAMVRVVDDIVSKWMGCIEWELGRRIILVCTLSICREVKHVRGVAGPAYSVCGMGANTILKALEL